MYSSTSCSAQCSTFVDCADRGIYIVRTTTTTQVNAPPLWLAVNALDHGNGGGPCNGRDGCIAFPLNNAGALTTSGCRVVSHYRAYQSGTIPMLTMVLIPVNDSIKLRATVTASACRFSFILRMLISLHTCKLQATHPPPHTHLSISSTTTIYNSPLCFSSSICE